MYHKVIAGAGKDEYYVDPKDVISINDLSLWVKYDSADKISKAIINEQLPIYYLHETKESENKALIIVCYPFYMHRNWLFEYTMQLDRIFFLKRDIQKLESRQKFFTQQDNILIVPEHRITTEENLISISKEIIMRAKSEGVIKDPIFYWFLHFIITNLMKLYYLLSGIFIKSHKVTELKGYTPEIPKEKLFDVHEYIAEHPWTTENEREDLALAISEKNPRPSYGIIGEGLRKEGEIDSPDANRKRSERLVERAKKRKKH